MDQVTGHVVSLLSWNSARGCDLDKVECSDVDGAERQRQHATTYELPSGNLT